MDHLLESLRSILTPVHDLATVYLAAPPPSEIRPSVEVDRRWRALAGELRAQGADEPTLKAVEPALRSAAIARVAVAVFARDGHVLHTQRLPGWVGADRANFGAPAHVLPLLGWLQSQIPYVLV